MNRILFPGSSSRLLEMANSDDVKREVPLRSKQIQIGKGYRYSSDIFKHRIDEDKIHRWGREGKFPPRKATWTVNEVSLIHVAGVETWNRHEQVHAQFYVALPSLVHGYCWKHRRWTRSFISSAENVHIFDAYCILWSNTKFYGLIRPNVTIKLVLIIGRNEFDPKRRWTISGQVSPKNSIMVRCLVKSWMTPLSADVLSLTVGRMILIIWLGKRFVYIINPCVLTSHSKQCLSVLQTA